MISFSGGVADCIRQESDWRKFGDIGPILGKTIRNSTLCRGEYRLSQEPIRATVIGAGCHSAQLSGSTVFYRGISLPVKNLPTAALKTELPTAAQIREALSRQEADTVVLALPGISSPQYEQVAALADAVVAGFEDRPVLVALQQDMAKALGHALALRLPRDRTILCIDNIHLTADSYLDVGVPVGPALPVVVKTLILSN